MLSRYLVVLLAVSQWAFAVEPSLAPADLVNQAKTTAVKAGEKIMVNINTATEADLQKVPGVSEANAKEIISHRPFKSVNELSKLKGFKQDLIAKIKPYLSVK